MIQPELLFSDSQLANAYSAGHGNQAVDGKGTPPDIRHLQGLFAVAEMAIAAFIRADYRATAPAIDRLAAAIESATINVQVKL